MRTDVDLFGIANIAKCSNGKTYIAPDNADGLFQLDLESLKIKRICTFKEQLKNVPVDLIQFGKDIFAVSRKGLRVYWYDTSTGITVTFAEYDSERDNLISVLYGDDLFIFPKCVPNTIIRFSIFEKKFYYDDYWNYEDDLTIEYLRTCVCDRKELIATVKGNPILLFCDLETKTIRKKRINGTEAFFGITTIKDGYCITLDNKREVLFYNRNNETCNFVRISEESGHYSRVIRYEKYLVLVTSNQVDLYANGKTITINHNIRSRNPNGSFFISYVIVNDRLLLFPWNAYRVMEISFNTFKCDSLSFNYDITDYVRLFKTLDEDELTLETFLSAI